jgi:hypothetical protein
MNTSQKGFEYLNKHQILVLNNSNPYLISPSATQLKQNTQINQPVISVDTIETTIPGATVFIGAPINVINITVNGISPSTDKISKDFTSVQCNPLSIVNTVNLAVPMRNTAGTTTFSNGDNTYVINLYGQIALTTGIDITAKQAVGQVPIDISDVSGTYSLGVYSASSGGGASAPTTVTTDTVGGTTPINSYTEVTFLTGAGPNALGAPGTNTGLTKTIVNNSAIPAPVTVTGTFFYDNISYSQLQFIYRGTSVVLNFDGSKWIVVITNPYVTML